MAQHSTAVHAWHKHIQYDQIRFEAGHFPESLLAIFVKGGTNVGSLLYELQRHRAAIAELL